MKQTDLIQLHLKAYKAFLEAIHVLQSQVETIILDLEKTLTELNTENLTGNSHNPTDSSTG